MLASGGSCQVKALHVHSAPLSSPVRSRASPEYSPAGPEAARARSPWPGAVSPLSVTAESEPTLQTGGRGSSHPLLAKYAHYRYEQGSRMCLIKDPRI